MNSFDVLEKLVGDARTEVAKVEGGQKAAGTRLRKAMMDVKRQAQVVRDEVLKGRKATGEAEE